MRVQARDEERTLWNISVLADCKPPLLVPSEQEFLFPPYSAFRVKSNRRDTMKHTDRYSNFPDIPVRVICLEVLADINAPEAQNKPTAPCY